ncbi:MAG: tyrosine-type recombinase/integrase [Methylibium sp.]|nr:tyrosine-type recombinase/integrase [Methylibium sp.]
MGRKRKDASQGLPERVYLRSGSFYFVHRDTGKWENIGKDLVAARKRAEHYNDPTGSYGTMAWFIDQFIIDCEQRVRAKDLSQRTLDDYRDAMRYLKSFFGAMLPTEIRPHHVTEYLDIGLKAGRAVRANRERACLSSCLSWMLRSNHGALVVNPCMRASGVVRNSETERDRYVTHEEYRAVYEVGNRAVRLMMELVYRTLQRPESDILFWTPSNIHQKAGSPVLRFVQNKTKTRIDISLEGQLGALVTAAIGAVPMLHQPILHTLKGEAYTYDGISAMLRQAQDRVRRTNPKLRDMASFGFRDLKGKGATDLWRSGVPLERIQALCGHKTKNTTEKYVKARWQETATPNSLDLGT